MTDNLDIPAFLDRRNTKGSTVTEAKKKRERKTILRLVVEYDPESFDMDNIKELIEAARGHGTIRTAKLTGLPTTTDLA